MTYGAAMPRLAGYKERRDQVFWDTFELRPGQRTRLFGTQNIGNLELCNLQVGNRINTSDQTAVIFSIGVRIPGLNIFEEDKLLDHFVVTLVVGDQPQWCGPATLCSTLRYVREDDAINPIDEPVQYSPGYIFKRPFIVPVRQNLAVSVEASKELPMPSITGKVMLFTLLTRDFTLLTRDVA